ncbi:MAG: hypothetical protein ACPL28_06625 [bacterium]
MRYEVNIGDDLDRELEIIAGIFEFDRYYKNQYDKNLDFGLACESRQDLISL